MLSLGIAHGNCPESCGVSRKEVDDIWHGPGVSSQAFPELDGQTLKHCRVVRLKFTPPLDWRCMLDATPTRFMAPGEWNGNDNERAFLMVRVSA